MSEKMREACLEAIRERPYAIMSDRSPGIYKDGFNDGYQAALSQPSVEEELRNTIWWAFKKSKNRKLGASIAPLDDEIARVILAKYHVIERNPK